MKKIILSVTLILGAVLSSAENNFAKIRDSGEVQKSDFAFLRHDAKTGLIEIYISPKLDDADTVAASFYRKDGKVARQFDRKINIIKCRDGFPSDGTCFSQTPDNFSKMTFKFALEVKPEDEFQILFSVSHLDKDGKTAENSEIIDVYKDFTTVSVDIEKFFDLRDFFPPDQVKQHRKPDVVTSITFEYPKPKDMPDHIFQKYKEERISELYDQITTHFGNPATFAEVRFQTLKGKDVTITENPFGISVFPTGKNQAFTKAKVIVYLATEKRFPADKAVLAVLLKDAPPVGLGDVFHNDSIELGAPAAPPADKITADMTLGLRDFKNNMDLGLAFTSSIKDKKDDAGTTVRKRDSKGYLDLRFAPIRNQPLNLNETWWFTPFFIDAKVSNNKISEDTLSLNRIILGTEFSYRHLTEKQNKYIYTFRGLNASDRDFKRVEGKFNFEFRPIFNKLNNPLEVQYKPEGTINIYENSKLRRNNIKGEFGWQIQPYAGFEVGRVYHSKRDFFDNEEKTLNLRRLIFGTDTVFNFTRYVNLKLSDVFYVRGESSEARLRNYFSGELQAPIIRSGDTAQHLFISFEKGDQPPFVTRAVNSFKIGYRVTTNWFGQTAAP